MVSVEVEITPESLSKLIARELLWDAETVTDKKLRKALLRAAQFHMTHTEQLAYFGKEGIDEYFK